LGKRKKAKNLLVTRGAKDSTDRSQKVVDRIYGVKYSEPENPGER